MHREFLALWRTWLDRKKNAIDMIYDWNTNTSSDADLVRRVCGNFYEECTPICPEDVKDLFEARSPEEIEAGKPSLREEEAGSTITHEKELSHTKQAIIRMLNYFEYVATAYRAKAANRRIIRDSFVLTMVRYYHGFENFLLRELAITGRNPWLPFTKFVERELLSRKVRCASCVHESKKRECPVESGNSLGLRWLNQAKLNQEEMMQVKNKVGVGSEFEEMFAAGEHTADGK